MSKINSHPILDVPKRDKVVFTFNGKKIEGEKGFTIAAALHQAGYPCIVTVWMAGDVL